jgi:dTDP-4-amino-4,6-dideoxygalactose transaminase
MSIWIGEKLSVIDFFSFLDAPKFLRQQWKAATDEIIDAGVFIGGRAVNKFESEWSEYLGVKHTVGVGNGYDAIYIALKALGIGKGDKVAIPSHTFVAPWLAVGAVGAEPIGIDCNENGLMDLNLLEDNPHPIAAVIPVHIHGQMVDMPRLVKWASKYKVRIIEDCAQSHGARINGKLAGSWGDFGAFSFYPTKNLGALGDSGAVVTNSEELANIARSYSNYGSKIGHKYSYKYQGLNSRLDSIQAAILSVNLQYLDLWNLKRREIASHYQSKLEKLGILFLPNQNNSVYHHFIVLSENRDESRALLKKIGINTEIHYPECAEISYGQIIKKNPTSSPKMAISLAAKTLSLPISPWMTDSKIEKILTSLASKDVLASFILK